MKTPVTVTVYVNEVEERVGVELSGVSVLLTEEKALELAEFISIAAMRLSALKEKGKKPHAQGQPDHV